MFVYRSSETDLGKFETGFVMPGPPAKFVRVKTHSTAQDAEAHVHYLNGGQLTETFAESLDSIAQSLTGIDKALREHRCSTQ
ncbi:MAG: hypothetical protein JOZ00_18365 [Mycobacterium sp.]|uniref:hypothetical protein n=1 Tax=Mycobacterium sp. TaxID=1785 RepID=UPI001ED7A01F|nr:hypothetical protein [Mycobacterium sp.]MBV8788637.1 hypothetical protein [Mycobacterium sp.]